MLRKFGIIAVLSLMALAFAAVPALAVAPTSVTSTGGLHVCEGTTLDVSPTKTDTSAFLTATGEVCGAGRTATATLSSTAVVETGCINPGIKGQQPQGLERSFTQVTGSERFNTRQGRGTFDVDTNAIVLPGRTCPPPQEPVVLSVTFTDIVLTITSQTGTITATFPDIDP